MYTIVGLGNPGPEYALTRHNAGFWLVDALARQEGGQFRLETRYFVEACRISLVGCEVWLLKPMTYMNRSGQAIAAWTRFYKLPPSALLVVHDDLDLPPGTVRLKRGGGHGGHNGLRSIITQLGSSDFARLRLGIGHPGDRREVVNYVLCRAPQAEQKLLDAAVQDALQEIPSLVAGQWERAVQVLHNRRVTAFTPLCPAESS